MLVLRLSRISPCRFGCREVRRVATAFGNLARRVVNVFENFALLLRLSEITPSCYGSREFRRAAHGSTCNVKKQSAETLYISHNHISSPSLRNAGEKTLCGRGVEERKRKSRGDAPS